MFKHEDHSKVTPKDFVLYAGLMISLYWSAVNLGILWFQYIDQLFPDALDSWVDPFSSSIRFAMASLIIMVPIFITLSVLINNDIREHEAKAGFWIRKWLLYITLLIAGVAVAIDLIALVNVFLAGEITIRFLLKVLVVLAIAGGGFAYYILDIRGFWKQHKRESQSVGGMVIFVVVMSIICGFLIAGTPGQQRDMRLDQERVNDLQLIQNQLVNYWQDKGALPEGLAALEDDLVGFSLPTDPVTEESYGYNPTGRTTFELCATFAIESNSPQPERFSQFGVTSGSWNHPEGTYCFSREIDPDRFPPEKERPLPIG